MGVLPIYIYNAVEDEWGFISSFSKEKQKKLIFDANRFSDCYLFANSFLPTFTYIAPLPIEEEFRHYFESLSNSRCTVLVPEPTTPFICENIAHDASLFSSLVASGKKAGILALYTYAITEHIFMLQKKLLTAGVVTILPEAPEEKNLSTIYYFGSKSGFRTSFSSFMPKGSIQTDTKAAINVAQELYSSSKGIVIKTDKGNAGQGVFIYKKTPQRTPLQLLKELILLFKKEQFKKKPPVIVEEYIDTSGEKKSPFPSIECFIHQNGMVEMQYYCNMMVTPEGEFYGMEMHKKVLSNAVIKKVFALANTIARKYQESGFRGRFDIDMIYDGKKVYASESNTRTTGGTDTYLIVKKLVGKNFFSKRYVLSTYIDLPRGVIPSFSNIKHLLSVYLFNKKTKTGLIINSESIIRNEGFSYILVGENREKTHLLNKKVRLILTNKKNKE